MLQRAASNAYSWWWASHIRTKQSKWLEQNLQDMEDKVSYMLKIIDEDGDSFAKRAEMYYRKRPELINFVEESYRAYRALAERYDHLSRELQNANHTIATVFPEQVQFAIDDEEGNFFETSIPSHDQDNSSKGLPAVLKPSIPKSPQIPKKDSKAPPMLISKKARIRKTVTSAAAATSSGLNKTEALEEIDKLHKGILVLQTEKEFAKSSYESGFAKYWDIEKQITEMQGRVCSLQDEFGVGTVIEDDEARTLMAGTALKSCQETLVQLQEKQERSAEEARVECQRIKETHEKLETLKDEILRNQTNRQELSEEHESVRASLDLTILDEKVGSMEQERHDMELLREKIKKQFELNSNTSLTATELAEKIDELVDKVITLETAVSSQTALAKRLRSETDELQSHLRSLEEDKETLIEGSDNTSNKLRELEEELSRVKNLNHGVEDQNNSLQTHFTEASCNLDHLYEKLQSVKPDEEVENSGLFQEVNAVPVAKPKEEFEEHEDMLAPGNGSLISKDMKTEEEEKKDEVPDLSNSVKTAVENFVQSHPSDHLDVLSEKHHELNQQEKEEKQDLAQKVDNDPDIEPQELGTKEEDQPNWRKLFLDGLEDREKILLEEYTSILRNYKDVKKKYSEVEKKNRDSLFELAMQIRELKNANDLKDEEIQSLRKLQTNPDENLDTSLTDFGQSEQERPNESITRGASSGFPDMSSPNSGQRPVLDMLDDQNVESKEGTEESTTSRNVKNSPRKEEEDEIKVIPVDEPHAVSTIEKKFRMDIDELLEENLEFWLRFSTSFHQIQKFQTSVQDLQAELSKLKDNKKQDGSTKHQSLKSDARPIYKHLREIQTELTLWFEHNALLKDELQIRFSSLSNIQEEISRVSNAGSKTKETDFSNYQAAKFQGEVLNMKQENNKIADELQAGLDRVGGLRIEIDTTLSKLDEDLGISASKNHHFHMRHSLSRSRIPFRSFLFGVKLKRQKPSIFACMNPALQKQYSDLAAGLPP